MSEKEKTYELKGVIRDGVTVTKLKCPKCGQWCDIDNDQYRGRISIWHDVPECGFHETIDLSQSKKAQWCDPSSLIPE